MYYSTTHSLEYPLFAPQQTQINSNKQNGDVYACQIEPIPVSFTDGVLTPAYSPVFVDHQANNLTSQQIPANHTEDIYKASKSLSVIPSLFLNTPSEEHWENSTLSFVESESPFSTSQNSSAHYLDELPYKDIHDDQQTAQILLQSIDSSSVSSPVDLFAPFTLSEDFYIPELFSNLSPSLSEPGIKLKTKKLIKRKRRTKKEKAELQHNENDVPIAEQLRNNTRIWEKIQQTKKKGVYKCAHCVKVFPNLYQFAQHLDEEKVVRPHKCPAKDCPWSILGLPRRAEVRRHCAAQHESSIEENGDPYTACQIDIFKCQYNDCDRVFKRKDSYTRHEKLVHLNAASRFNKRVSKVNKAKQMTKISDDPPIISRSVPSF